MKDSLKIAFSFLLGKSGKQGFLSFDDIFSVSKEFRLAISEVDYLTNLLFERNIIIQEKDTSSNIKEQTRKNDFDEAEFENFAHLDYDKIFSEIKSLSPIQEYFVNYVKNIIPPQRNEIQTLQYQVLESNIYARTRMIEMHLRQALKIALYFCKTYEQSLDDMISLSCEGLINAVDNYKPDFNGAFSSYATLWMMQVCNRGFATKCPLIHYPAHFMELYIKLFKNKELLYNDDIISSDKKHIETLSKFLGCSEKSTYRIISAFYPFRNFESIYNWCCSLFDSTDFYDHENECLDFILCRKINGFLDDCVKNTKLQAKELKILKERNGYYTNRNLTLATLGKKYGLTRERVRQIEKKAILKILNGKYKTKLFELYNYLET